MVDVAARRAEYEGRGLDVGDLDPDPIVQFRRWMADAEEAKLVEPTAMALSTAGANAMPTNRFVLLRGLDERGFAFYTNHLSEKGTELAANPRAALLFGWLALHRQVRVSGDVEQFDDAEADAYFAGRPRGSQLGAWASPQSVVVVDRAEIDRLVADAEKRFGDATRAAAGVLGRLSRASRRGRVLAGPAEPAARSPALPARRRCLGHRAPRALAALGAAQQTDVEGRVRRLVAELLAGSERLGGSLEIVLARRCDDIAQRLVPGSQRGDESRLTGLVVLRDVQRGELARLGVADVRKLLPDARDVGERAGIAELVDLTRRRDADRVALRHQLRMGEALRATAPPATGGEDGEQAGEQDEGQAHSTTLADAAAATRQAGTVWGNGAIAQLGERRAGSAEVSGSSPLSSIALWS